MADLLTEVYRFPWVGLQQLEAEMLPLWDQLLTMPRLVIEGDTYLISVRLFCTEKQPCDGE